MGTNVEMKTVPPRIVGLATTRSRAAGSVVNHPSILCTRPCRVVVVLPSRVVTPATPLTWVVLPVHTTQMEAFETFRRSCRSQLDNVDSVHPPVRTGSLTPKKCWVSVLPISRVL